MISVRSGRFEPIKFWNYLNMLAVKWYVSQYHHLDIQGVVIFQTGIVLLTHPVYHGYLSELTPPCLNILSRYKAKIDTVYKMRQ